MAKDENVKELLAKLAGKRSGFNERHAADKLRKQLPPIRTVGEDWFSYIDGAWMETQRPEFLPKALGTLNNPYRKARNAESILDHIAAGSQLPASQMIGFHKFELEPDGARSILINVANGVLKIWPGGERSLEKHNPSHGFTSKTSASFDENAACPLFTSTLESALPDPLDRILLQSFCGNILWPTAEFETALISFGKEGTGKSKIAEAIAGTLREPGAGGYLVTALSMHNLCDGKSYSLTKLQRAALNLGTEVDTIDLPESANFKQLVSGEAIEARPIYGAPIQMRSTCKLWFLANSIPRFKDGSGAELRRLRFLRFDVTPLNPDTELGTKLARERDGIFLWMLEGLGRLHDGGRIPQGGQSSTQVIFSFAASNDPVRWFVETRCELNSSYSTRKEDITKAFEDMVEELSLPPAVVSILFRKLYHNWPGITPRRERMKSATKPVYYVDGIRLID